MPDDHRLLLDAWQQLNEHGCITDEQTDYGDGSFYHEWRVWFTIMTYFGMLSNACTAPEMSDEWIKRSYSAGASRVLFEDFCRESTFYKAQVWTR